VVTSAGSGPSIVVVVDRRVAAGTRVVGDRGGKVRGGTVRGGSVPGAGIRIWVRNASISGWFDAIGFAEYGHPGSAPRRPDGSVYTSGLLSPYTYVLSKAVPGP
jgi:hypothetical protein